jgi:quinolinate synthase
VHEKFSLEKILQLKKEHPGAKVIAHPECKAPVLMVADYVGSTAALLFYTKVDESKEYIVVTESGILYEMRKANPHKTFIPAPPIDSTCGCNDCEFMKMITLEKIYKCLADESPEITIPESVRRQAEGSIKAMLELSV